MTRRDGREYTLARFTNFQRFCLLINSKNLCFFFYIFNTVESRVELLSAFYFAGTHFECVKSNGVNTIYGLSI